MENIIPPASADPSPQKPKKWRRRLLHGAVVVLTGGLVVMAPAIASTGPVRRAVLAQVNAGIPGQLAVDDWSFSWLGNDWVKGISYTDDGGHSLSIGQVSLARPTLLGALGGSRVAEVEVDHVRGQLPTVFRDKAPKGHEAPGADKPPQAPRAVPEGGVLLAIRDVDVSLEAAGQKPVRVTGDAVTLDARDLGRVTLEAGAKAEQEGGPAGTIILKVTLTKLLDKDRMPDAAGAEADMTLDVTGLPVAALDALAGRGDGAIEKALNAKMLDAHVAAKGGFKNLQADLAVTADGRPLATGKAASDGKALTGSLHAELPNAALLALVPADSWKEKKKPALSGKVAVDATLESLVFDPADKTANVAGVAGLQSIRAAANVSGFETALVGALAGKEDLVRDALGGQVDVSVKLKTQDNHLLAQITPKGDTLGGTVTADISSSKPHWHEVALGGGVTWDATEKCAAQFIKATPAAEGKPAGGLEPHGTFRLVTNFTGTNLLLGEKGLDWGTSTVAVSAHGEGMVLSDVAKGRDYAVALPAFKLSGLDLKEKLDANLTLTLTPVPAAGGAAGKVKVSARVLTPVAGGVFDPAAAAREARVEATGIPLALADAVVNKDDAVQTFAGARLERAEIGMRQAAPAKASASKPAIPAPMEIEVRELRATKAQVAQVAATLFADGEVKLGKDLEVLMDVTPTLAARYGAMINPVLGLAQSGTTPVKLLAKAESFHFNLNDPQAAQTHLEANLDPGTLQLAYGGILKQVGDVLKMTQVLPKGLPENPSVKIPSVGLTLSGTQLHYRDFKIKYGALVMDFSGAVDWKTQGIDLSMRLPGESLAAMSPSLGKYIKSDMTLPLTGSVTAPKLDTAAMQKSLLAMGAKAGVQGLLESKLGDKAGADVKDALGGLLGVGKKKPAPNAPKDAPQETPAPASKKPKDLLKDLLGK